MADKQDQIARKNYIKPEVTEVRLVAGEAVLGYCKFNDGGDALCGSDITCDGLTPRS